MINLRKSRGRLDTDTQMIRVKNILVFLPYEEIIFINILIYSDSANHNIVEENAEIIVKIIYVWLNKNIWIKQEEIHIFDPPQPGSRGHASSWGQEAGAEIDLLDTSGQLVNFEIQTPDVELIMSTIF